MLSYQYRWIYAVTCDNSWIPITVYLELLQPLLERTEEHIQPMENKDAYGDSEKQILFAQSTRTINWTGAVVGKVTVTP
jgi:hypothetical protein